MASPHATRRPAGLPSNPRAAQAARRTSPPVTVPAPQPQRIREKRSLPSMPSPRPPNVDSYGRGNSPGLRHKKSFHSTHRSALSVSSSSSASSLRSSDSRSSSSTDASSLRSSVTSVDDSTEPQEQKQEGPPKAFWQGPSAYSIDGASVWKSVTGVASLVGQEVNKVWATGINPLNTSTTGDNESTHLFNVMRQYHLAKATNPVDLPEWLFSERERGSRSDGTSSEASRNRQAKPEQPRGPKHLGSVPVRDDKPVIRSQREPRLPSGTIGGSASDRLRAKRSVHRQPARF